MAEKYTKQFKTNAESKMKVKEEDGSYSQAEHSHSVNVKFKSSDREEYTITCKQPHTVLEVLKSSKKFDALKCTDENIVIQLRKADKEFTVATHFPCSCIKRGESLIISCEEETVEQSPGHNEEIFSRSKYSVFYIDTVGGKNTKTKRFLRNNNIKMFKYLCVYGEKGTTVEDALQRDGRFIDDLGEFTLSDNENPDSHTEHTQYVDDLHKKKFKLCLPRNLQQKTPGRPQQKTNLKKIQQKSNNTADVEQQSGSSVKTDVAHQSGSSVKTTREKRVSDNSEEVYKILCEQFPGLKKWMESRFPHDSYQKALNLRKENFGKIQNSFSEVHTIRYLFNLGNSVCQIKINSLSSTLKVDGTGFVLFDNYVLTNAHLFEPFAKQHGVNWQNNINITAKFNYENSSSESNQNSFNGNIIYSSNNDLDYAILVLMGQKHSQETETEKTEEAEIPPGLLKKCGPLPEGGGACIIGHPKGEVKKMDVTCVIESEKREQAVNSNLEDYGDYIFTLCSINHAIKTDPRANDIVTYNTFMYHGSSGSPVFNAHGQVFGLHSAGFFYGFPKDDQSVIEYAHPLLHIFENFVNVLKENKEEKLLKRVQEEAKGNSHLEKVIKSVVGSSEVNTEEENFLKQPKDEAADPDEYLDNSEPMQVG